MKRPHKAPLSKSMRAGGLARWMAAIPAPRLQGGGQFIGGLAYHLDVRHRRIVRRNLTFVYPEWSRHQIDRMAAGVFRHFGTVLLENIQALFLSRRQFVERIVIEGQDILTAALEQPRGCLLVSGHLGNWELGLLAGAANLNRTALTVAKPIKLKPVHQLLTALRSRFGNRVVFKEGALPLMTRSLREGQTLIMLIDQGVRRTEAVEIRFFGKRTLASPAAAYLAFRCRVPVVPIFCLRAPSGRYHLKILPPVAPTRTTSLRADIQAYTQKMMETVETAVRRDPEQWFWFHKRWKRTYPELYPEYQVLRR
ncbi:MAG: lysophospholipid acyltransferase family protein, partial [Desulfosarcina sp.]|nr:lysophospholipid acyltransferase family protein [Desulfobacterales bacterium]